MQEVQVFENVSSLSVKGHGNVSVCEDGTIECERGTKFEKVGNTLNIVSAGRGGGLVISGGVMTFGGGGSVSNMVCDGQSISIVNGQVFINGKRARVDGEEKEEKKEQEPEKLRKLADNCTIQNISVTSSATVRIARKFCNTTSLVCSVAGSGDIILPSHTHFGSLTLSVTGSGDIKGMSETTADTCVATVTGSGDIQAVKVVKNAVMTVTGSGDIALKKGSSDTTVTRNVVGSGSAKCK